MHARTRIYQYLFFFQTLLPIFFTDTPYTTSNPTRTSAYRNNFTLQKNTSIEKIISAKFRKLVSNNPFIIRIPFLSKILDPFLPLENREKKKKKGKNTTNYVINKKDDGSIMRDLVVWGRNACARASAFSVITGRSIVCQETGRESHFSGCPLLGLTTLSPFAYTLLMDGSVICSSKSIIRPTKFESIESIVRGQSVLRKK